MMLVARCNFHGSNTIKSWVHPRVGLDGIFLAFGALDWVEI